MTDFEKLRFELMLDSLLELLRRLQDEIARITDNEIEIPAERLDKLP